MITLASLEQELLIMWRQVLDVDELNVHDRFTERGGTPDRGGRLIEMLEKRFELILHLPWLVAAPTIHDQAKWLLYRCFPGPPPAELARPQEWRDAFAKRFPDQPEAAPGPPLPSMVFVLSAARTGSTLLRIMLAGHSKLFCPPEPELLLFQDMRARRQGLMDGWSDFKGLEKALMELQGLSEEQAAQTTDQMLQANLSTYSIYSQLQQLCAPRLLLEKATSYPLSRPALRRAELWFDRPRYIHLVRHPLACIRSWTACNFDQVVYGHPRQAGEMDWLLSNENILEHLSGVEPERQTRVRYEDVLTDAESEMRRLCHFLQIGYEESLLQPYSGERMTGRLNGLVSGDKMFYRKSEIDQSALEGARRLPGDSPLTEETMLMATRLGYGDL
ncbi:sulfotransferase [bacterium]|nr:sulfotransferase [bacterium]